MTETRNGRTPPVAPIRWIVTDLDGTLVGADLRIVPRSAAALRRFRDAGGQVFLATGRNEVSAGRYHAELGLDTPAILYNGARVCDLSTADVLYANDIGAGYARLRDEVIGRLPPQVGAVAFADGRPVVVHDAAVLSDYARRDGVRLLPDAAAAEGASVIKVLLVHERPDLEATAAAVHAACPDLVTVASEPTYLEVLAPGASKGEALRWLAEERGVPMAQIAAIGDNHNDAAMLAAAAIGAAPSGADGALRERADLVVGSCADGAVADLVEHVLARNAGVHDGPVTVPDQRSPATYALRARGREHEQ